MNILSYNPEKIRRKKKLKVGRGKEARVKKKKKKVAGVYYDNKKRRKKTQN